MMNIYVNIYAGLLGQLRAAALDQVHAPLSTAYRTVLHLSIVRQGLVLIRAVNSGCFIIDHFSITVFLQLWYPNATFYYELKDNLSKAYNNDSDDNDLFI